MTAAFHLHNREAKRELKFKNNGKILPFCLVPTDNLPVLSGIQSAELRRQGATFSLANCSSYDPGHILHSRLTELQAASKESLKSRHLFVPNARKLLHNLSELDIRAAQWTNFTWDTEYSKSMSALGVYILRVSTKPIEMSLTRTQLGSNSIACVLALGVSVRRCTNEVSLLERNASMVLKNKLQTKLFKHVPYIGHFKKLWV